ncbi:hypothetical protein L226DRAFT_495291 [Lentinus tigrinus ALCF2SS1-7]|uniref:Copper-fist domain-containing protein n=1 Tax=Lentinus tigrinus ALCF2SS1-6 TaxID=1328759 RepID=A0A5C2S6Q7_9APHY|nr:hypothetical protein L227DRAFT_576207 [Lentinus tigrinus ALCF2SS1-6]RPD68773.1 hypothetical protein L226DRAFT_495291 [Lentinus tigrinus ALCF2SS1-7]
MVLVNDKKFACESCIKGHRSSGCQHTDRPLFEVKKKGRPVSQCEKCRELRKTKRMHGKCTCATTSAAGSSAEAKAADGSAPKAKARRFKPIAPALPNGLKDVGTLDADARANVSVNLCRCGGKDATICTCGHERAAPKISKKVIATDGLATLAQAAMFCCGSEFPSTTIDTPREPPALAAAPTESASRKHTRSCCSSSPSSRPPSPKPKRSKHWSSYGHPASPALPPLSLPQTHAPSTAPVFPPIAPLGTSVSFDEAGCCCGRECACPGCTVHRGAEHAAKDVADCTDGECRTCVDHEGGVALPEHVVAYSQGRGYASSSATPLPPPLSARSSSALVVSAPSPSPRTSRDRRQSVSCIDAFFATAASLPAPPPGRPKLLDPTNVLVYPRGVLAGDAETRSLFGLVEVPKLQCNCPGGCGCPEGQCGCGDGCTGCGSSHAEEQEPEPVPERSTPKAGSCCSG